ncbi:hypothetical protein LFADAHJC_LOCUS739 [Methylorubrum extorquens]
MPCNVINCTACLKGIGRDLIERRFVPVWSDEECAIFRLPVQFTFGNINDNASSEDFSCLSIALVVPPSQDPTNATFDGAHAILNNEQSALLTDAIDVGKKLVLVGRKNRFRVSRQRQSYCGLHWIETEQRSGDGVSNGAIVCEIRFPNANLRRNQGIRQKSKPISLCIIRHTVTPKRRLKYVDD